MRPLSELSVADLSGVFCDLDDTLTTGGKLVPAAFQALADLVAGGLRVVVVTGRPGGWAEVLAALFPVEAVIGENGALAVLGAGGHLYWDGEEARAEQRRRLEALTRDALERLPFARLADDAPLRRVDVAFDVGERLRLPAEEREALVALIRSHGARSVTSTVHTHAFYGDYDKAKMAARLAAERWGEDAAALKARYLFVGDSPNDQAAFTFFPRSAGVANVARYAADLAPPPAFIATREGGEGFAEIARAVLHPSTRSGRTE